MEIQLTKIEIRNFRNLANISMTLGGAAAYITGMNGTGKTSIQEAVRLALFKRCKYTDAGGKGVGRQIRHGAKEAEITVYLDLALPDGPMPVRVHLLIRNNKREWDFINTETGEVLCEKPEEFWLMAGISMKLAELCTLPLGGPDFDSVLSEYLSEEITIETVQALSGTHQDWLTDFVAKNFPTRRPQHIDDWRKLGDYAYARRTTLNAELKQARVDFEGLQYAPPVVDKNGAPLDVQDIPKVNGFLIGLTSKRDTLLIELGGARDPQVEWKRKDLVKRVAEAQAQVDALQQGIASDQEKEQGVTEQKHILVNRQCDARGSLGSFDSDISRLEAECAKLATGTCPTCGHEIDPALLDAAQAALDSLRECKQGKADKVAEFEAQIVNLRARAGDYKTAWQQGQRDVTKAMTELCVLQDELAPLPTSTGRVAEAVRADIEQAEASITGCNDAIKGLRRLQDRQGHVARIEVLEADVAHLDWAVQSFEKGILLNKIIGGDKKTALLTQINAVLARFQYSFTLESSGKNWNVLVKRDGSTELPRYFHELSEGEQTITQIAFALALSNGRCPVIVDDIDGLDGERKNTFRLLLQDARNLITAGHWAQTNQPDFALLARAFAPAGVWWVENGSAYPVIAGEAAAAI